MSEDLPEPETPVIQVKTPTGIFAFTCCKLFSHASIISINLLGFLAVLGKSIFHYSEPIYNALFVDPLKFLRIGLIK